MTPTWKMSLLATLKYLDQADGFDVSAAAEGNSHIIGVSSSITHKGMMGGPDFWRAKRASYVRVRPGEPACLLSLDRKASAAVKIQGSTQVKMDGCVIAANSHAADAVSRGGSAELDAECVSTVGRTVGLSSLTKLACGNPLENQYASLDPLAGVTPPAYTACKSMPGGKTKSLTPGTFCNKTWSGDITLDPGVYILRGGQVKLGGNGRLVGHGVTIFLMEGATFDSERQRSHRSFAPDQRDGSLCRHHHLPGKGQYRSAYNQWRLRVVGDWVRLCARCACVLCGKLHHVRVRRLHSGDRQYGRDDWKFCDQGQLLG